MVLEENRVTFSHKRSGSSAVKFPNYECPRAYRSLVLFLQLFPIERTEEQTLIHPGNQRIIRRKTRHKRASIFKNHL